VLKRYFLQAKQGYWKRGAREGRGSLMCVSTSVRIVKSIQLSQTIVVL